MRNFINQIDPVLFLIGVIVFIGLCLVAAIVFIFILKGKIEELEYIAKIEAKHKKNMKEGVKRFVDQLNSLTHNYNEYKKQNLPQRDLKTGRFQKRFAQK